MIDYTMHDAAFTLPDQLKDKTMHLFTLNDNGPSDFTLVVSRAELDQEDTLQTFSDRIVRELAKTMPKFELKERSEVEVDGQPAVEIRYAWRSEGVFLHQRQTIVLTSSDRPGAQRAMSIIGTCPKAFPETWANNYQQIIASVRLHRPLLADEPAVVVPAPIEESTPVPEPDTPSVGASTVFAFIGATSTLHVLRDEMAANGAFKAREIRQHGIEFFDAGGQPLRVLFVGPESADGVPSIDAHYQLRRDRVPQRPPLQSLLGSIRHLQGSAELPSLADVRVFLSSAKGH